jgi:hypothetical protein
MALDVDQLRTGLDDYRRILALQRERLQDEFTDLQQLLDLLWSQYGGAMAEDFQHRWGVTAEWFEEYLHNAKHLDLFLAERIEALRHL